MKGQTKRKLVWYTLALIGYIVLGIFLNLYMDYQEASLIEDQNNCIVFCESKALDFLDYRVEDMGNNICLCQNKKIEQFSYQVG